MGSCGWTVEAAAGTGVGVDTSLDAVFALRSSLEGFEGSAGGLMVYLVVIRVY